MTQWAWVIPLLLFFLLFNKAKYSDLKTLGSALIIALLLLVYSSKNTAVFYNNVRSLYASMYEENVGIQYSNEQINAVKELIEKHPPTTGKPAMYYMRGDLAYIAYLIHGKSVYTYRIVTEPKSQWEKEAFKDKYELIEIEEDTTIPMTDPVLQMLDLKRKP